MLMAPGQKMIDRLTGGAGKKKMTRKQLETVGLGVRVGDSFPLAQVVVTNRGFFLAFIVASVWNLFEIAQNKGN